MGEEHRVWKRPLCRGALLKRATFRADFVSSDGINLSIMNVSPPDRRKNMRELALEIGIRVLLFGVFV